MAHVLFNARNCTRILAGWLKQNQVYKQITGTLQNAFRWELPREPSLELWGSSSQALSSTQNWLPAVLCSPYYRVGSLCHCACQMSALWHLACSPFHSLLNPVFTLTCLIYQNVSKHIAARQSGGVRTIRHFTKLQPTVLLSANRKQREATGSS